MTATQPRDVGDWAADHADDDRTVHQRMAAALADLTAIAKERSSGVSYTFRSIDAVMNHLHPVLARHGLFLSPQVLDDWRIENVQTINRDGSARSAVQATFRVQVTVFGANGDRVILGPGLAQSLDYGDKAAYQAQQNAIKYVLLESFAIPTNDDQDMDARQVEAPPPFDVKKFARKATEAFHEWDIETRSRQWLRAAQELHDEGVHPTAKPADAVEGTRIVNRMVDYYVDEDGHEWRGRKPKAKAEEGGES
jgi:hypothetical protein